MAADPIEPIGTDGTVEAVAWADRAVVSSAKLRRMNRNERRLDARVTTAQTTADAANTTANAAAAGGVSDHFLYMGC